MKNLQTLLDLSGTQVTDAGLKELAGVKNLQAACLSGSTKVKGSGLKELAGLKDLQRCCSAIPKLVPQRSGAWFAVHGERRPEVAEGNEMCRLILILVTTNIWTQSAGPGVEVSRSRMKRAPIQLRDWALSWDKPGAEEISGSGSGIGTAPART